MKHLVQHDRLVRDHDGRRGCVREAVVDDRDIRESPIHVAVDVPRKRSAIRLHDADPDLTLETELTALYADEGRGVARAAMNGVLLATTSQFGTRVVGQFARDATVPIPGGIAPGGAPDAAAAAMAAALGAVLSLIVSDLAAYA